MSPKASIIIGSETDKAIIQQAETILNEYLVPFETTLIAPNNIEAQIASITQKFHLEGTRVIIAGTRGNFDFVNKIAASTAIPVIGIPMRSDTEANSLESVFTALQQPLSTPIASVALDSGHNAGILAVQILATNDDVLMEKIVAFKESLKNKILKADKELSAIKFEYRTN